MLKAVTFDWGDTLMQDAWDDEIARAGNAAGLAALGSRPGLPDADALTAWWVRPEQPVWDHRREDELDWLALKRVGFEELGADLDDAELATFTEAMYADWSGRIAVAQHAHALLEALRGRGLKLGIISNVVSPGYLVRQAMEQQGIAARVDAVVLSCEVGKRKPHAAIFEHALEKLGVAPGEALHVGDKLHHDVGGAAAAGMKTVQALWFHADDAAEGREADFEAFTMFDVLNIVDRIAGR